MAASFLALPGMAKRVVLHDLLLFVLFVIRNWNKTFIIFFCNTNFFWFLPSWGFEPLRMYSTHVFLNASADSTGSCWIERSKWGRETFTTTCARARFPGYTFLRHIILALNTVNSQISFWGTEKWRRKPEKNSCLRRLEFTPRNNAVQEFRLRPLLN